MEKPSRSPPRAREAEAAASAIIETIRAVRVMAVPPARRDTSFGRRVPGKELGREPVLKDLLHAGAEDVDVVRGPVDAGSDAQTVELGMDDPRRHDAVLVPLSPLKVP